MRLLLAALLFGALLAPAAAGGELVAPRAVGLIIEYEIGSQALYERRYQRPVWPGAASGVTVGIGYDLGHRHAAVIAADWRDHPQPRRLASAAGVTGQPARALAAALALEVSVGWPMALTVFEQTSLVEHYRIARRVFGAPHFDRMPTNAQGALVSLVFNRGGAMVGPARLELRTIRDDCLPRTDRACVAAQLRAMVRLWQGSAIEAGMRRRRYAEAALAEAA
jgi:hypothetical protein